MAQIKGGEDEFLVASLAAAFEKFFSVIKMEQKKAELKGDDITADSLYEAIAKYW